MSVPDIHTCSRLSKENATLRRKIIQLKQARDEAEGKLTVLLEKNKIDSLLRSYCTTRDSSVQTEPRPWHARGVPSAPKTASDMDVEKTNKIITMHAQLLKRYEKEVKQNVANTETISELTVQVANLDRRLKEEQEKNSALQRELMAVKGKQTGKTKSKADEDPVLREVVKERNKLNAENKRLRQELKGLDKGFFDEVEDLKYALQQSAKLNQEYEKTLKKFCHQFGVAYPCPEKVLDAS